MSDGEQDGLSTLVLTVGYEPVNVVNWRRAFCMVFTERATVVEEHEKMVRSPQRSFRAPSVIRLSRSVERHRPKVKRSKRSLFERDSFTCQYCNKRFQPDELTVDHVLPKSLGGTMDWSNSVTSCKACNNAKGNKMPHEAGMKLIRPPVVPRTEPYLLIRRILGNRVSPEWIPYLFWDVDPQAVVKTGGSSKS